MPLRGVGFDLVLVDDPVQGGAVTEFVVEYLGRDAVQGKEVVVLQAGFVFAEAHFFHAIVQRFVRVFDVLQGVFGLGFVVDVDVGQAFTGVHEGPEVLRLNKGNARQFAAQVGGVGFAVGGVVQQGVNVVEDVPFGQFPLSRLPRRGRRTSEVRRTWAVA